MILRRLRLLLWLILVFVHVVTVLGHRHLRSPRNRDLLHVVVVAAVAVALGDRRLHSVVRGFRLCVVPAGIRRGNRLAAAIFGLLVRFHRGYRRPVESLVLDHVRLALGHLWC